MNRTFATLPRPRNARRTRPFHTVRARTVHAGPRPQAIWRANPAPDRPAPRWLRVYPDPDPDPFQARHSLRRA